MKLEVGKSYRRRDGSGPVVIVKNDGTDIPFKDDDGYWYCADGEYYTERHSNLDLVAEWDEPATCQEHTMATEGSPPPESWLSVAKQLAEAGHSTAALWVLQNKV